MRATVLVLVTALAATTAGAAQAQTTAPKKFNCSELPNPSTDIKIAPVFRPDAGLAENEFDCLAWQDFIYLNWPVVKGQRGVPDNQARLGAAGPTVWETYKTVYDLFLPAARDPGPWNGLLARPTLSGVLSASVDNGGIRQLTTTSKISRAAFANVLSHANGTPEYLRDIAQAGGGTLYDLNGVPVYYEVGVNRLVYDYVVSNQLYDAEKQVMFAAKNVVVLPTSGPDNPNNETSLVYKAAWKVLTPPEQQSGRFHITRALIEGSKTPVSVGLVGFHMFVVNKGQGAWATFSQVDNAPVVAPIQSKRFSFFNPNCKVPGTQTPCPANVKDADPGQVIQVRPIPTTSGQLNDYVHSLLRTYDPKSVWQYYNLIDVQWAKLPVTIAGLSAPANAPLAKGDPNVKVLLNPVLETFVQHKDLSCMDCHQFASAAAPNGQPPQSFATDYTFIFGHAQDSHPNLPK